MTTTAAKVMDASAARIELEVRIEAPAEHVWKTITESTDGWWIRDLRVVPGGSEVTLDATAGGHMIEKGASGGSLLWFTVIAVEPNRSLNMVGHVAPPFGGPSTGFLLLQLEPDGDATVLKLTNSMHGHVDESSLPMIESGWKQLLLEGIKSFAETGSAAG